MQKVAKKCFVCCSVEGAPKRLQLLLLGGDFCMHPLGGFQCLSAPFLGFLGESRYCLTSLLASWTRFRAWRTFASRSRTWFSSSSILESCSADLIRSPSPSRFATAKASSISPILSVSRCLFLGGCELAVDGLNRSFGVGKLVCSVRQRILFERNQRQPLACLVETKTIIT